MAEQVLIQLKLPEQTITRTEAKKLFMDYESRQLMFRKCCLMKLMLKL